MVFSTSRIGSTTRRKITSDLRSSNERFCTWRSMGEEGENKSSSSPSTSSSRDCTASKWPSTM
jgi:hypothetical protein